MWAWLPDVVVEPIQKRCFKRALLAMHFLRRAPQSPQRLQRPPTKIFHKQALQNLRNKFAGTWKACGHAKKIASQVVERDPMANWVRVVQRKLLRLLHHTYSQILKEVKYNARIER